MPLAPNKLVTSAENTAFLEQHDPKTLINTRQQTHPIQAS